MQIKKEFGICWFKGAACLTIIFIIFNIFLAHALDESIWKILVYLMLVSSIVYNLNESRSHNITTNLLLVLFVPVGIFVFNSMYLQDYITFDIIIYVILGFNLVFAIYYMISHNWYPKLYNKEEYYSYCDLPRPSMNKILWIFLLSSAMIGCTYFFNYFNEFTIDLENASSEVIPGSNITINLYAKYDLPYPYCITPKIRLIIDGTLDGIYIKCNPEIVEPNHYSKIIINVSEDAPADSYSIGIQGRWDKDILGVQAEKSLQLNVKPLVSLKHDPPNNSAVAGTTINYTAKCANNSKNLTYEFQKIGQLYNISGDQSTNASWLWETNRSDTGINTIIVTVIDRNDTNWCKTATDTFYIEENKPPMIKYINKSIYADSYTTIAFDRENDDIYYNYSIKSEEDASWTTVRDWDPSPYWAKSISLEPGKYIVRVTVKDKHNDPDKYCWDHMNDTSYLLVSGKKNKKQHVELSWSPNPKEDTSKTQIEIGPEPDSVTQSIEQSGLEVHPADKAIQEDRQIPGTRERAEIIENTIEFQAFT